jgi:CheY-like chemotaxis protein
MSGDPEKVLILAKEAMARSCLRRMLEALGFDVGEAANGEDALRRMRNHAQKEQDYAALEALYAGDYMLVRPDGSVLNKQEVLQDLRSGGLRFRSIELGQTEVRIYGSTAVLTAESQAVSSRHGVESRSHFRLIAVYVQQGQSIMLVHFQSTSLG